MCLAVFGVLGLLLPIMLLITAVLALGSHGPVGWLLALLLVLAVLSACVLASRWVAAWWRSTKAPERHRPATGS